MHDIRVVPIGNPGRAITLSQIRYAGLAYSKPLSGLVVRFGRVSW